MVASLVKSFVWSVVLLCLVQLSIGGTLEDVELIPEQMRSVGAELLGKSLSLDMRSVERLRRAPGHPQRQQEAEDSWLVMAPSDLTPASSEVFAQQRYGDAAGQVYGGKKQAAEYYNNENNGVARGEVGFFGRAAKKGVQDHASNQGYQGQEKDIHDEKSNSGFYKGANGATNLRDVGQSQESENDFSRNGQGVEKYSRKGGHRKGHHKSGFTNSYHKDESGSKSDFFDDSNDEGGHFLANAQGGSFNDRQGSRQHGRVNQGEFKNEHQGKNGDYDQSQNFNDKNVQREDYARDRYNQDEENFGRQASGKSYNKNIHDAGEYQNANQFGKNGKVYGQRQSYVPYEQPIIPVDNGYQRNYYPVDDVSRDVGLNQSPIYQSTPGQAYQPERSEYYPSASVFYPRKVNNYYVPARNGRGKANVQVLDNYEEPTSNGQYYVVAQPAAYYPARAY